MLFCCSYYQIIVVRKWAGGNPADEKYESVTLTYDTQEDGKPYITAELAQDDSAKSRTSFLVGDGKYYSRIGVTDSKRKRRDALCMLPLSNNRGIGPFVLLIFLSFPFLSLRFLLFHFFSFHHLSFAFFCFVFFTFISFRFLCFVLFHRFVPCCFVQFVSFCFVSFRFLLSRFLSFRLVLSFPFVSYRAVSCRFLSFRSVLFCFVSFRFVLFFLVFCRVVSSCVLSVCFLSCRFFKIITKHGVQCVD